MKTKNILYSAAAIALLAACSNEELVSVDSLKGTTIDASSFTLVSEEDAATRLVATPGYDLDGAGNGTTWTFPANKWENGDAIGFTHIYPSDQRIVTNYKFTTTAATTPAQFQTDNSTIFAGDYFVYYPFNKDYADYDGIPFEMDAIQKQDASATAIVKASDVLNTTTEAAFKAAGKHLDKFSIGNRITVDAKVQQSAFSLTQFTGRIYLRMFPVNQTKAIYIKRVEMTCDGSFEVGGRFNAQAGVAAPNFVADKTANKLVLTFNNVADPTDPNAVSGMKLALGTLEKDAVMGYMSILPGTYKNVKFDIYYTETGNLKKVTIDKSANDIKIESNKNYRIGMPIDANGAVEATSYEIYSESEFEAAVKKSNAMNAGTSSEAVFTLMDNIKLTKKYRLEASVPVTFNGGKNIEIENATGNERLEIMSKAPVVINNTLTGGNAGNPASANFDVKIGERVAAPGTEINPDVTIAAVNSERLVIANIRGDVKILNANGQGKIGQLQNRWKLSVENAAVKSWLDSQDITGAATADKPMVSLKNVTVDGYATISSANSAAASSIEGVTVKGNFTNKGTVNAKGTNSLAAVTTTTTFNNTDGTFNVLEGTTTVGTVAESGIINIDTEMIANGDVTMTTDKMVTINDDAKLTVKGALATLRPANMNIEGTLVTEGKVTLAGNFEMCGVIENYGAWTLNHKISQRNHGHSTKAAKFKNAGVVTVNGIDATTNETAINRMAKSLYEQVDNGRLIWRGMPSLTIVDNFAKLSADKCWATDFCAVIDLSSGDVAETFTADLDWSAKNIIIEANAATTNQKYTLKLGANQMKAKNLTIETYARGAAGGAQFTTTHSGTTPAFDVTETLTLRNALAGTDSNLVDLNSALCKDVVANNVYNRVFTIKNGLNILYTGTYSTTGYTAKTSYPNNIPQHTNP